MPAITYDEFSGGLDVRPAAALARGNVMRVLTNAYITSGKAIKKRPCLALTATLEAGTVGLRAFGGKLNTFYGQGATITHADSRFVSRRIPYQGTGASPVKVHYADQYLAQLYVAAEYAGPLFQHHYLDDPGAWITVHAYAANSFVRPVAANGFRYECTAGGGGNSGGAEPAWPTTLGLTVVDGALTWTCRSFAVTDANCPHSKQVTKVQQKMYAAGVDLTTVRYCKTGNARDWTAVSDAGFLGVGLYARGSDQVTALNIYGRMLGVFFSDNTQIWNVDPNPANNTITDAIDSVGTLYSYGAGPVSRDLFFPAQNGVKSLTFLSLTNNLQDNDVGSAIDTLVRASLATTDNPLGIYYPKLGQYWIINGNFAWVYSFSRAAKVSAWSKYTFPFSVNDVTVLNQEMYVRSGDSVYQVSDAVFKDGVSSIPLVDVQMYHTDARLPGMLKMFVGIDIIGLGMWTVSHKYFNENGVEQETDAYEYPAVTEPGPQYPVELMATRIAPHLQHQKDEAAELSLMSIYYEKEAVIA